MSVGIDLEGRKDVLGIWIGEHESAKFWLNVLNELKNRGVQDILIICVDNLTGFSEAIAACYPQSEVQKCIVHQIRNSIRYVSYKDVKKIIAGLKPIYTALTEDAALEELNLFEKAWGEKYPLIVRSCVKIGLKSRLSLSTHPKCVKLSILRIPLKATIASRERELNLRASFRLTRPCLKCSTWPPSHRVLTPFLVCLSTYHFGVPDGFSYVKLRT